MATLIERVSDALTRAAQEIKTLRTERPRGLEVFCSGKPANNEVIGGGISPYAFTINEVNCSARSIVAFTASTVFALKRNGTQFGTVTFNAAATTGTVNVTTGSTQVVAKGDYITVTGPATADATGADIMVLLVE